jgi:hypothetical protein
LTSSNLTLAGLLFLWSFKITEMFT